LLFFETTLKDIYKQLQNKINHPPSEIIYVKIIRLMYWLSRILLCFDIIYIFII